MHSPNGTVQQLTQRSERRFKPQQTVTITVLALTPGPVLQGCMADLSRNGMRLRTTVPLESGTPIEITLNGVVSQARVRRCTPLESKYEIGVQVTSE